MDLTNLSRLFYFLEFCEVCGIQLLWVGGTKFIVNHFEVNSMIIDEEVSRRDTNEKMGTFIESYLTLKWTIEDEWQNILIFYL